MRFYPTPFGPPADYLAKHPFGRIPVFEHDEISLYETSAITRYIDEAFDGPPRQPVDPVHRARCNQVISIADNDAYPSLVWGVYVERISKPGRGVPTDEDKVRAALPAARNCLAALSQLMGEAPWFVGGQPTLADFYAAPLFDDVLMTPEGADLIRQHANRQEWWERMESRPSMAATGPS